MNLPNPNYEYMFSGYEADLIRRVVHIRKVPLIYGMPNPSHPAVAWVSLTDAPVPPEVPVPSEPRPEYPGEKPTGVSVDEWQKVIDDHGKAVQAWSEKNGGYLSNVEARKRALSEQDLSAWLDDPRPDHLKAEDHWQKVISRG